MNYNQLQTILGAMVMGISIVTTWLAVLSIMKKKDIILGVCYGVVTWLTLLFLITETTGIFRVLSRTSLLIAWGLVILIEVSVCIFNRKGLKKNKKYIMDQAAQGLRVLSSDKVVLVSMIAIVFLLVRSTWLAMNTVPDNYDSMTYHLTRIMYWIQHRSAGYFETPDVRHLVSPVLAEYVNLHLVLLTGNDLLVNLVQNVSSYGCVLLVFGILKKLNVSTAWATTGCIALLTMNAFSAEAITTQTDIVAAFILLIDVYLMLTVLSSKRLQCEPETCFVFLFLGLCSGLLYITKGQAAIVALAVAVFIIISRIVKKDVFLTLLKLGTIAIVMALIIAFPSFFRNSKHFSDPLASNYMNTIAIGTKELRYILMNIVKNYGNLAVGKTNPEELVHIANEIAQWLKVDINDGAISFDNKEYALYYSLTMDSSSIYVIAPILLVCLLVGLAFSVIRRRDYDFISFVFLLTVPLSMGIIRWQPWVVRLLIPSICVGLIGAFYFINAIFHAPLQNSRSDIGLARVRLFAGYIFGTLLVFQCIACSFDSFEYLKSVAMQNIRHEKAREELYYTYNSGAYPAYKEIKDYVSQREGKKIGLSIDVGVYQYPIMAEFYQDRDFEYITMQKDNITDEGLNRHYSPDMIVVMEQALETAEKYYCNGFGYECTYASQDYPTYSVWEKMGDKGGEAMDG